MGNACFTLSCKPMPYDILEWFDGLINEIMGNFFGQECIFSVDLELL